jgi:hypothetical protein
MARLRSAARALAGCDDGQSLLELSVTILLALALVGAIFVAFTKIAAGGPVPFEQCIEHQSCQAAADAHGY